MAKTPAQIQPVTSACLLARLLVPEDVPGPILVAAMLPYHLLYRFYLFHSGIYRQQHPHASACQVCGLVTGAFTSSLRQQLSRQQNVSA